MNKILCLATLMVMLVLSSPAQAQQGQGMPACVNELGPCRPFVNSTTATPPTACCQPFAMLLRNDLSCLCSIFVSVQVTRSLNINVTEAATLPMRCGLQFDLAARCQAILMGPSGAPAMSPIPSMAPSPVSPAPALVMAPSVSPNAALAPTPTPALAPGQSTGGAGNIEWAGSVIMGSFLIWATLMFY